VGGYGTAKTLILKTAVAEAPRADKEAVYTSMVDLLDELRAAYDENKASRALVERIHYYTALPLLALDEIDRVKETNGRASASSRSSTGATHLPSWGGERRCWRATPARRRWTATCAAVPGTAGSRWWRCRGRICGRGCE